MLKKHLVLWVDPPGTEVLRAVTVETTVQENARELQKYLKAVSREWRLACSSDKSRLVFCIGFNVRLLLGPCEIDFEPVVK